MAKSFMQGPFLSIKFAVTLELVPTCHGQVVLCPFGHENLMDVDVADVEGYGATAEVKVPHAGKFFSTGSDNFIADVLEVIEPAHKGLIVVAAQAFASTGCRCFHRGR